MDLDGIIFLGIVEAVYAASGAAVSYAFSAVTLTQGAALGATAGVVSIVALLLFDDTVFDIERSRLKWATATSCLSTAFVYAGSALVGNPLTLQMAAVFAGGNATIPMLLLAILFSDELAFDVLAKDSLFLLGGAALPFLAITASAYVATAHFGAAIPAWFAASH